MTWLASPGPTSYGRRPRSATVSAAGSVGRPDGGHELFPRSWVSTTADWPGGIACGPANCLVAWASGDVWARFTTHSGVPTGADYVLASAASEDQRTPAVAATDGGYLVVWADARSASQHEVYGARISALGESMDPAGIHLSPGTTGSVEEPVLATQANGSLLLAYTAFDQEPGVLAQRLRVRRLEPAAPDGGPGGSDVGTGAGAIGIARTPRVILRCNELYRSPAQGGQPVVGPGPVRWSLEPDEGQALPEGLTVDETGGAIAWRPAPGAAGSHRVTLVAQGSGWIDRQPLEFEVRCAAGGLSVGLGCASLAPGWPVAGALSASLPALALVLLGRRRRAQRAQQKERPS